MSEQTPETPVDKTAPKQPAKKAAAKKTAAKKSARASTVTIFLIGTSHNGADGDRRRVDAERAEQLVRAGLARYPANSG